MKVFLFVLTLASSSLLSMNNNAARTIPYSKNPYTLEKIVTNCEKANTDFINLAASTLAKKSLPLNQWPLEDKNKILQASIKSGNINFISLVTKYLSTK